VVTTLSRMGRDGVTQSRAATLGTMLAERPNMRLFPSLYLAPLALTSLAGCTVPDLIDNGHPGGVYFAYASCVKHCGLDEGAMTAGGATTSVSVQNGPQFAQAISSDDTVVTISKVEGSILTVVSGKAGKAELRLLDAHGARLAGATITVAATAELRVTPGWTGDAPRLLAGDSRWFHVTTYDAGGAVTHGSSAVKFTFSPSLTRGSGQPFFGDEVEFSGTVGEGTIDADCPDAHLTQKVQIVADGEVTALVSKVGTSQSGNPTAVVTAQSAAGPVYGRCKWEGSDPSIEIQDSDFVGGRLDNAAGDETIFVLHGSGSGRSYSATCTMAGQSTTVQLHR
jgi:hypothetical protein